jgi:membrane protease YdiL (CAAX protease family)
MKKIIQFPLVRMLIAILVIGVAITIGQMLLNLLRAAFSITNTTLANFMAFLLVVPTVYFAYWIYVHAVEKRKLIELGRAHALPEFGLGALIGFGLFALVIAVLWVLGYYRVNGISFIFLPLIGALVGALVSAFAQELIFRAAIYRITEEWLGTWWALVISAILFGLIHLTSAGATIFTAMSVALQAGILLGAAYVYTHRVWMALGIHAAWDFANDGVFGVGIAWQSGESLKGLFQARLSGPDLLTGGALGVEASIITLVLTLIAGILILRMAYKKDHFVFPKRKGQRMSVQAANSNSE